MTIHIKRVEPDYLVQLLISKFEMAFAYASIKIVFVVLSLLPQNHARSKNFAATMDTISKSEREHCFRQCSRQSSCRFFGINMNGRCHMFAEAPLTMSTYMRRYQKPAASLSVTSVDFGSKDHGKIALAGGNEVKAPDRGLVVARLNPDLKELVIGDFKKFDTYQSDGAKQFKNYIEKLDVGAIVIAANSDDVFTSLQNHFNYLKSEGLDLKRLQFRGKMAFIFQKGYPDKTIAVTMPPGGGSLATKFQVFVPYVGAKADLYHFTSPDSQPMTGC